MSNLSTDKTRDIVDKLLADEVVDTVLQTDQRVISRITDGIYRQPSSALRELGQSNEIAIQYELIIAVYQSGTNLDTDTYIVGLALVYTVVAQSGR